METYLPCKSGPKQHHGVQTKLQTKFMVTFTVPDLTDFKCQQSHYYVPRRLSPSSAKLLLTLSKTVGSIKLLFSCTKEQHF